MNASWSLRAIYAAIGLSTASLAPFVSVILRQRGLDPAAVGAVAAAGALLAALVVPGWGHLADVMVGRVRAFRIALAIAAAASVGLLFDLPIVVIAGLMASFTVYASLFVGLADALAMGVLSAPERQYGALRAFASMAFTVGVVAVGFLYSWYGYGAAPAVFLVWAVALMFLVGRLPDKGPNSSVRDARGTLASGTDGAPSHVARASRRGILHVGRLGSIGRAFEAQPRLLRVLGVFAFTFAGLEGSMIFVGIRIVELGGQPSDVAMSFGISAFFEIPGLVAAGWLGSRIGLRWLFLLSLALLGPCIASWGVLPSAWAINATRVAIGLGSGSLMASQVLVVPRLLPESLQATGQVLFQGVTLGLGSVLGGVIGGVVYQAFGPAVFFASAAVVVIVGAVAMWLVLEGEVGGRLTGRPPDAISIAYPPTTW